MPAVLASAVLLAAASWAAASAAAAAASGSTSAAAVCTSNFDCHLNGVCNGGVCACHSGEPWGGATCGELLFQATPPGAGYGQLPFVESSWGGAAILDPVSGLYHLFVAEMVNNCSLGSWGQASRVTHATSPTPDGPYAFADVAIDVWSHNPEAHLIRGGGAGGADLWAIWHIGDGTGTAPNCSAHAAAAVDGSLALPPTTLQARARGGSELHLANSPYGPWTPYTDGPLPDCNNPTAAQHVNGTWFLICDSFSMYSGPNITGPFTFVMNVPHGGTPGIFEDGLLWFDERGVWRVFFHTYTMDCKDPSCAPYAISGHSFSTDGLSWHLASVQPYFNVANVTDGSQIVMSTRERPKLIFDARGRPTHLSNGICPTPACPPAAAIQCKVTDNRWTRHLIVPLAYAP